MLYANQRSRSLFWYSSSNCLPSCDIDHRNWLLKNKSFFEMYWLTFCKFLFVFMSHYTKDFVQLNIENVLFCRCVDWRVQWVSACSVCVPWGAEDSPRRHLHPLQDIPAWRHSLPHQGPVPWVFTVKCFLHISIVYKCFAGIKNLKTFRLM